MAFDFVEVFKEMYIIQGPSIGTCANIYSYFFFIQQKLRQAILKGSMAPGGHCQDLESSSEVST